MEIRKDGSRSGQQIFFWLAFSSSHLQIGGNTMDHVIDLNGF